MACCAAIRGCRLDWTSMPSLSHLMTMIGLAHKGQGQAQAQAQAQAGPAAPTRNEANSQPTHTHTQKVTDAVGACVERAWWGGRFCSLVTQVGRCRQRFKATNSSPRQQRNLDQKKKKKKREKAVLPFYFCGFIFTLIFWSQEKKKTLLSHFRNVLYCCTLSASARPLYPHLQLLYNTVRLTVFHRALA